MKRRSRLCPSPEQMGQTWSGCRLARTLHLFLRMMPRGQSSFSLAPICDSFRVASGNPETQTSRKRETVSMFQKFVMVMVYVFRVSTPPTFRLHMNNFIFNDNPNKGGLPWGFQSADILTKRLASAAASCSATALQDLGANHAIS